MDSQCPPTNGDLATLATPAVHRVRVVNKRASFTHGTLETATLYVDDEQVYEVVGDQSINPLLQVLYFLSGYMSECQHKPTHMRCIERTQVPFTLTMGDAD